MLPEGAHNRKHDITYFFLNRKSNSKISLQQQSSLIQSIPDISTYPKYNLKEFRKSKISNFLDRYLFILFKLMVFNKKNGIFLDLPTKFQEMQRTKHLSI